MNRKELKFILQKGEGLKTEFKEGIGGVDKEMVAFANSEGGRIFLGITDTQGGHENLQAGKSKIKDIEITNKLKSQIQDIARNCDPLIKISLEELDNILIINIEEGKDKLYKCSSGFYLRQGANSQKMLRNEILDFATGEGKIRFDEQIKNDFEFPSDFDEKKLDKYLKLAKITKNLNKEKILINLGVAVKEKKKFKLNNAGILFFAKNSKKFFLTSKVICVNYQTNEKVNILDKKIFDDGVINNIQEGVNYVQKHINVEYEIKKLERKEIPQYPPEAIRECIVNAIMHRDYFDKSGDILIEIFKNKIMVSNPGGLVKWMKPEDFGTTSRTRNSVVANLLSKTIYVEKLGTGINRIKKAMSDVKLPKPEFRFNTSFFVTLYDKTFLEKVSKTGGLSGGLSGGLKLLLEFIKDNQGIQIKDISRKLNKPINTLDKQIRTLVKENLIERRGSKKTGGYWAK